jgi:hypothetical protein
MININDTGTESLVTSGEKNGFMVEVGWEGQEQERYEVVGQFLPTE